VIKIAVLDYGIGNLRSAEKALQHVGAAAHLVTDPAEVEAADAVVLPGVGAFGACARALGESGLEPVARAALGAGVPFFGVREGVGGFSQRIASVDLRREFSGLAELAKGRQVVSIHFRNEKCELLPDER